MTPTTCHDCPRTRYTGNTTPPLALAAYPSSWAGFEEADGDTASLDNALRLAWLWLGGVFLPCAGIALYALSLQVSP